MGVCLVWVEVIAVKLLSQSREGGPVLH